MEINGIPILVVVGVVAILAVIIAKTWRTLVKWVLLIGGVVVLVVIAWTLLQSNDVIPQDAQDTISDVADIARVLRPEPEPTYSAPASGGGGFVAGLLTAFVIMALGVAGYCYARWRLSERQSQRPRAQAVRRPEPRREIQPWTQQALQIPPVYYVTDDEQGVSMPEVDPSQWGW